MRLTILSSMVRFSKHLPLTLSNLVAKFGGPEYLVILFLDTPCVILLDYNVKVICVQRSLIVRTRVREVFQALVANCR